MDGSRATVAAILAALMWTAACTRGGVPEPDAQPVPPRADAAPAVDAAGRDVAVLVACLDPGQLDAQPPAAFYVWGCLWHTLDGEKPRAVFQWQNLTGQEQVAPYGPTNRVSPGSEAQGQPVSFLIGDLDHFAVPFDGTPVTWSVLGQDVTVSPSSLDCGAICPQITYLGCVDCVPIEEDLCPVACGDGVCDYGETCKACPADCDCSALHPLVDCVLPLDGGKKLVNFGYDNRAATGGGVEIGPDNQFLPGPSARGQTIHFDTGEHHTVFQVTYAGPDVTWMVAGNAVTVSPDAPLCAEGCGFSCTCVSNQCLGSCGDGLCIGWEGCASCPDDCACQDGEVCSNDRCGPRPSCERYVRECGTIDAFGVHVDCGSCPVGEGCTRNGWCEPICPVGPGTPGSP